MKPSKKVFYNRAMKDKAFLTAFALRLLTSPVRGVTKSLAVIHDVALFPAYIAYSIKGKKAKNSALAGFLEGQINTQEKLLSFGKKPLAAYKAQHNRLTSQLTKEAFEAQYGKPTGPIDALLKMNGQKLQDQQARSDFDQAGNKNVTPEQPSSKPSPAPKAPKHKK